MSEYLVKVTSFVKVKLKDASKGSDRRCGLSEVNSPTTCVEQPLSSGDGAHGTGSAGVEGSIPSLSINISRADAEVIHCMMSELFHALNLSPKETAVLMTLRAALKAWEGQPYIVDENGNKGWIIP